MSAQGEISERHNILIGRGGALLGSFVIAELAVEIGHAVWQIHSQEQVRPTRGLGRVLDLHLVNDGAACADGPAPGQGAPKTDVLGARLVNFGVRLRALADAIQAARADGATILFVDIKFKAVNSQLLLAALEARLRRSREAHRLDVELAVALEVAEGNLNLAHLVGANVGPRGRVGHKHSGAWGRCK